MEEAFSLAFTVYGLAIVISFAVAVLIKLLSNSLRSLEG